MQKSYRRLWECTLWHCHVVGGFLECWRVVVDVSYYNCDRCVTFQIRASVVSCLEETKREDRGKEKQWMPIFLHFSYKTKIVY